MQWEFAGRLGPPPGRYVVRRYAGDDVRAVVVVTPAVAPRRSARREPRRPARRESPGTVEVTRVTVIDASSGAAASDWYGRAEATLAQFLTAHRVAVGDPDAPGPGSAVVVRTGTGTGARLAEGDCDDARELPAPEPPGRPRRSKHRPAERLAALMSGRDAVLACEELTLRARGDLLHGRNREAALQLEAALSAAVAELKGWIAQGDLEVRVAELGNLLPEVREAAAAACEGRLEAPQVEVVAAALARLEAALRARALLAAE